VGCQRVVARSHGVPNPYCRRRPQTTWQREKVGEEAAQEERMGRQTRGELRTCCSRGAILHVCSSFIFLEILLLRIEFLLIYRLLPYARFYLRANRLICSRPAAPAIVQKMVRERERNRHGELHLQQRRTERSCTRSNATR